MLMYQCFLHFLNLLLLHNQTNPIQFTFHFGSGKNVLIFAAFFINKIVKKDYSSLSIEQIVYRLLSLLLYQL